MKRGDRGWVGDQVLLRGMRPGGEIQLYGVAYLESQTGDVRCTDPETQRDWDSAGITDRFGLNRLYPRDGQAFLDELPYMYRSAYLWAEPAGNSADGAAPTGDTT